MSRETYDASDEEEVRLQQDRLRSISERELEDVRSILLTKEGRRFFWKYLGECGLFKETHCGERTHDSAFKEGQRSVGLYLLRAMNASVPEAYSQMQKEALEFEQIIDQKIKQDKKNKENRNV